MGVSNRNPLPSRGPLFSGGELLVSGRVGTTEICQVGKRTTSRLSLPESQREDLDVTSRLEYLLSMALLDWLGILCPP